MALALNKKTARQYVPEKKNYHNLKTDSLWGPSMKYLVYSMKKTADVV